MTGKAPIRRQQHVDQHGRLQRAKRMAEQKP